MDKITRWRGVDLPRRAGKFEQFLLLSDDQQLIGFEHRETIKWWLITDGQLIAQAEMSHDLPDIVLRYVAQKRLSGYVIFINTRMQNRVEGEQFTVRTKTINYGENSMRLQAIETTKERKNA